MQKDLETTPEVLEPAVSEANGERASDEEANAQTGLVDLERRLGERIQQEVERRFQSAKDKRWAQLEKQYGALSEMSSAAGQSEAPSVSGGKEAALISAQRLLTQAGLIHDKEALELLQQYKAESPDADTRLLEQIGQLAVRKLGRSPAKAGAVIQPGGGMAAPDLRADYERRLRQVRPGDVAGLAELKREFRKKGLEVF